MLNKREARAQRAVERIAARAARSAAAQLKRLDEKLGDGVGAVRERAKLAKQIAEAKGGTNA
jgi:hypothetical protein